MAVIRRQPENCRNRSFVLRPFFSRSAVVLFPHTTASGFGDDMLELIQELIAFKYACKLKHWQARNYGQHLLYDRLIENIDKWVDDIAEKIFMASGEAEQLDYNILRPELVNTDLTESIRQLLEKIEQLKAENAEPEGIPTLLGDISKDFLTKLALVRMENAE
jgi:hypothetical protein